MIVSLLSTIFIVLDSDYMRDVARSLRLLDLSLTNSRNRFP